MREVAPGERVGYGGSWNARRPSRIAVLGAGYGDGYPRSLASAAGREPARVRIGEFFAPLIGRVSMDMITVDVTDIPQRRRRAARSPNSSAPTSRWMRSP